MWEDHAVVRSIAALAAAATFVGLGLAVGLVINRPNANPGVALAPEADGFVGQEQPSTDEVAGPEQPSTDEVAGPEQPSTDKVADPEQPSTNEVADPEQPSTNEVVGEEESPALPAATRLSALPIVDQELTYGSIAEFRASELAGDLYQDALWIQTQIGGWSRKGWTRVSFNLGSDYSRFRAVVGLSDDAPDTSELELLLTVDGENELYRKSFRLGESESIDVDVEGVLRLSIRVSDLAEIEYDIPRSFVLADAVLLPG